MPAAPPAAMPDPSGPGATLLGFNGQLLQQAADLAQAHLLPGRPRYGGLAGPHLRHVIEHYEALLWPREAGIVDYDARVRDAQLEASPQQAMARLQALQAALRTCSAERLDAPLQVLGQCGLLGDDVFSARSSLGRELAFVASHALHHYALLGGYCAQHAIPVPEGFGRAPATRAHERARTPAGPSPGVSPAASPAASFLAMPQLSASPATASPHVAAARPASALL